MLDLIIRGGQVVTPWGVGDWEIAVQGEKIVAVAEMSNGKVHMVKNAVKVTIGGCGG